MKKMTRRRPTENDDDIVKDGEYVHVPWYLLDVEEPPPYVRHDPIPMFEPAPPPAPKPAPAPAPAPEVNASDSAQIAADGIPLDYHRPGYRFVGDRSAQDAAYNEMVRRVRLENGGASRRRYRACRRAAIVRGRAGGRLSAL